MIKAAFFGNSLANVDTVYGKGRRQQVERLAEVYPDLVGEENFAEHAEGLGETDVLFCTWGMPALADEHLDRLPALKAVFYATG